MLKRLLTFSGFKLSLLITLMVSVVFVYNALFAPEGSFLNLLDKKWVDFILRERGTAEHTPEVVIATIDTKSVDAYGRWPWPRSRIAQIVTALTKYEVATIGFDVVFSEPEHGQTQSLIRKYKKEFSRLKFQDRTKKAKFSRFLDSERRKLDGDEQLAQAIKKANNVVLGYLFFSRKEDLVHLTDEDKEKSASHIAGSEISLIRGRVGVNKLLTGLAVEPNIPKISEAGIYSGSFNMAPDPEDGTVRRVHLLLKYKENIYPALALQMLRQYYGADNMVVDGDQETGNVMAITLGNKVIIPNIDSSILINYKGGEKTFPHYPVVDIINGTIPKEQLEGKIVLIGATEAGVFDLRTTPVGVAFPGVEVHANLLDNMLTDSYFQINDGNHMMTLILLLFFGLFLGIAIPNLKSIYGTVLALGLLAVYLFVQRWMVVNLLTWTSAVYVILLVISIWGGVTLYRFLVTDKDKRFIKGAFQQYLSPEVINQLMENPDLLQLGGERKVLTAFFSDVAGFSTISEQLSPEDLVALLNYYLTDMSNIIMDYEGTVDKYEGDAIIAFFGAPIDYEDHAYRACCVTLDMQARLAEMRTEWEAEGKPLLKMRIGLNTGPMVVGNMGSENRFDYTMMGNSVNLAARLEGANKNYGSYDCISEMTYEIVKDKMDVRELDLIRVMGITTPVRIYELIARKGEMKENQKKAFAYFARGLELYREQQWDEAKKYFNAVYKFIPEDPPSTNFIERCNEFKAAPPAKDWDGVFTASSK